MLDGVSVIESKAQKDEIILEGNDVQNVSQSGTFTTFCEELSPKPTFIFQPHLYRVPVVSGTRISERFVATIS
jgi:hypothetical protein